MQLPVFCRRVGIDSSRFQKVIADALTGPEHEVLVLLPRGQGKTSLVAAFADQHLITTPNAAVYCAAASREQARILFEAATVRPAARDEHVVHRHLELRLVRRPRHSPKSSPLTSACSPPTRPPARAHADAGDHRRAARPPRRRGLSALKTAALKTPGARLIVISTAGQGADTPLGRLRARALAQPDVTTDGAFTDARGGGLRMLEWRCRRTAMSTTRLSSSKRTRRRGSPRKGSPAKRPRFRTSRTGGTTATSGVSV
jgi:hypothetical protein